MSKGALDPLLAGALKLEQLPVIHGRREADAVAAVLMGQCERLGMLAHGETDPESEAQLTHVMEALGVMMISLMAYARGRVPKVRGEALPGTSIIQQ